MFNKRLKLWQIVFVVLFIIAVLWMLYKLYVPEPNIPKIDLQNLQSPCLIDRTCGDLVGVDCASAVDGPYYYVDKGSERIIARCGGYCMAKEQREYCQKNCPPKNWSCETY